MFAARNFACWNVNEAIVFWIEYPHVQYVVKAVSAFSMANSSLAFILALTAAVEISSCRYAKIILFIGFKFLLNLPLTDY